MSGTTGMPRSARISSASGVVGPFAPSTIELRVELPRVLVSDLALKGGRDEDVARRLEDLGLADLVGAVEAADEAVLGLVLEELLDVDAGVVVEAARDVG